MAMTAQQLLSEISRRQLVPAAVLQSLQRQVSSASKPVAARAILKLLVEKGHLSAEQGQSLLAGTIAASGDSGKRRSSDAAAEPAVGELPPLEALDDLQPLGEEALQPLQGAGFDPFAAHSGSEPLDLAQAPTAVATAVPVTGVATGAVPPTAQRSKTAQAAVGAVALLAVVLVAMAGVMFLPRGDGSVQLEEALAAYEAQSYRPAADKLTLFLNQYPRSPRADEARVYLAMARIKSAKAGGAASSELLTVCEQALADAGGGDLAPVHEQLAPLLADLALDLVQQAQQARSTDDVAQRLDEARRAMTLADNGRYLPGALRPWQRLADAAETLALVEHEANRGGRRAAALAAMDQAISAKDAMAATRQRDMLLALDPEAAADAQLAEIGSRLAQLDAAGVRASGGGGSPLADEPLSAASVSFVSKSTTASAQPCFVAAAGSIWAIDSVGGGVLCRRAVGDGGGTSLAAVSSGPENSVILADSAHNEIVCVRAESGMLRWRYPLKSPLAAAPLVVADRVIGVTRGGEVLALDAASGQQQAAVQLPYGIRVAPALAAESQTLYVVADRLHAFMLDARDLQCRGAVYLGHDAACVAVQPVICGGRLVVAENAGPTKCRLHVVALGERVPGRSGPTIELPGNVLAPPVATASRLYVATDIGTLHSFEATGDGATSLTRGAALQLPAAGRLLRYPAALDGSLWIGDLGLRSFRTAADGALQEEASLFAGAAVVAPLQPVGDALICLRREAGRPGLIAAAVESNGRVRWETPLAAPIVAVSIAPDTADQVHILTALGGHASVELAAVEHSAVRAATRDTASQLLPPIAAAVSLVGGRQALVPEGDGDEIYVADAALGEIREFAVPASRTSEPLGWAGGLLVPCAPAAVWLLDAETGLPRAAPLLLPAAPGQRLRCELAAAGDDASSFVVSDGGKQLYEVALEQQPQPHLAIRSQASLSHPLQAKLAATSGALLAVDAAGTAHAFSLPGLKPLATAQLGSPVVTFGPKRVGGVVLLTTADNGMHCLGGDGQPRWQQSFDGGPLAGDPIEHAGRILLATATGKLVQLDAASGDELARLDLGQPLAGSPLIAGASLLVPTADGTLLKVKLTEAESASP